MEVKLRNKKTGGVDDFRIEASGLEWMGYASLKEFCEVWEDYEEPTGINEIDVVLDAIGEYCNEHSYYSGDLEKIKILNAVEDKLKAWKRLKEKGFRFVGITETSLEMDCVEFEIGKDFYKEQSIRNSELNKDLDLLFGGEE